jgi:hypothetical protein
MPPAVVKTISSTVTQFDYGEISHLAGVEQLRIGTYNARPATGL